MKLNWIFSNIIAQTASTGIGISAVGTMLFLSSCRLSGIPSDDFMFTPMEERRARSIIDQAFSAQGIIMDHDTVMSFFLPKITLTDETKDTTILIPVDGFNNSLKIGYEYISEENEEYSYLISHPTDTTGRVRFLSTVDVHDSASLVSQTNKFIDSLKSAGIVK